MITAFTAGLIDNVAYNSRSRTPPAAIAENCRVDNQGWLVRRKGLTAIDALPESDLQIPEYPEVEDIEVTYGEAGGLGAPGEFRQVDLVFQAVKVDETDLEQELPDIQGDTGEPLPVLSPKTLIGTHSEPVTVEAIDVINAESQYGLHEGGFDEGSRANIHTLKALYDATDKTIDIRYRIVGDITLTIQIAKSETLEIVRTLRYERVHLDGGESDREPDQTGSDQGPRRKQVQWDGNDDFGVPVPAGKYFVAFTERRPIIPNPSTDPVTEYSYHYSYLEFELESTYIHITANATADANFIDVFATLEGRVGYYWIARMPAGETIVYKFPLFDNFTPQVTEFELPEVEYIARNDLRTYTAEVGSDTVYVSHYDAGTGERLVYNYTHIIPLELGDGFITGLVFTRERNLVVYCSNQIQIITTGALIEQHGVLDFIQPSDEKGERVGTAAPGSIVDMGGHHFFLATNRYVYMFDAQRAIKVSDAIHGIFQQIELSRTSDGNVELENGVVAFAHDNHYAISVGDKTLVYDTVHGVWWQDTFSVSKAIRDDTGRVYGEIDGNAYILYEGDDDDGQPIQRRFKSNPYNQHSHSQWDSVHVYALGSAIIEVVCSTEQSTARGMLEIPDAGDWWSQRLGVNLQGRYYEVEIITESDVAIDRIMVNERMRKRRGR